MDKLTLGEILKSINMKTKLYSRSDIERDYTPFIINRIMSTFADTLQHAHNVTKSNLSKYDQYLYYYYAIRKRSRFSKWVKPKKYNDIDVVKEYYKYSDTKAMIALRILSKDQIKSLYDLTFKGGRS